MGFGENQPHPSHPIATKPFQPPTALPPEFFCRPAQEVAPELIGCLLLKRQVGGELLGGVIVETEAYCQCVAEGFCEAVPACHGHRRRSPSNETLFGEPGHWYVYVSFGIHHCTKGLSARNWQDIFLFISSFMLCIFDATNF